MKSDEIRKKYIEFFVNAPRNHKAISPSPLVLQGDATTLFTSAGMQQLVPYLSGKKHPKGKRLVNSQPSLRTQDIDEVGDNRHTTFFEMLGNWSLGDYFKEEQLPWFWEFLTKELGLPNERLWVSVFKGDKEVPKDQESFEIWKKLGVPQEKIREYGVKENWWSMTGSPSEMHQGDIGGPDSEVFFEFTQVKHNPKFGKSCHPNCQCGRFLEIGNSVFIEYVKRQDGSLEELPQKNVDFGGGLERLVAAVEEDPDIFKVDPIWPVIEVIEETSGIKYEDKKEEMRIVADHMRASVFLAAEGIEPSNKLHGYTMRRLVRRSVFKMRQLGMVVLKEIPKITESVLAVYSNSYLKGVDNIKTHPVIGFEADKFLNTLSKGIRYLESQKKIDSKVAFNSLATYGIPFEVTQEIAKKRGDSINRTVFEKEFERHQKLSRAAGAGVFKGGLADHSEETIKLHTATHLLHWALRKILGESVRQEGSNVTAERLRFDFSHPQKLTDEEVKKVEKLINEKIKEDLPVTKTIEDKDEALKSGALAFFKETYPEKVSVYTIGKDPKKDWVSKELCGGPHVKTTSEIGRVRIKKQDKIGSNLIRIYAALENG